MTAFLPGPSCGNATAIGLHLLNHDGSQAAKVRLASS